MEKNNITNESVIRCSWAEASPTLKHYHDTEWGKPLYDDLKIFELLSLELMQAGLSWDIILKRRASLNAAYSNFNPHELIKYSKEEIEELYQDSRVIKNKLKINAVFNNAHKYFEIIDQYGSFSNYFWSFVNNEPIINNVTDESLVPAKNDLSEKLAKDLKRRGFKFIGPTITYSFMQAIGMINDHLNTCHYK